MKNLKELPFTELVAMRNEAIMIIDSTEASFVNELKFQVEQINEEILNRIYNTH